MPNPVLESLRQQVERNTSVEKSATILINGFASRLQNAVNEALANGATAEELAPVTDEIAALSSSAADLAAAVESNT